MSNKNKKNIFLLSFSFLLILYSHIYSKDKGNHIKINFFISGFYEKQELRNFGLYQKTKEKVKITLYDPIFKSPFIILITEPKKIKYYNFFEKKENIFVVKNENRKYFSGFSYKDLNYLITFKFLKDKYKTPRNLVLKNNRIETKDKSIIIKLSRFYSIEDEKIPLNIFVYSQRYHIKLGINIRTISFSKISPNIFNIRFKGKRNIFIIE